MANNIIRELNLKGTSYDINISENMIGDGLTSDSDSKLTLDIKTVNGENLIGEGDINIDTTYPLVKHYSSNTTFTLSPNVYYIWDVVSSLTLTLEDVVDNIMNEYIFQFSTNSEDMILLLPESIKWANNYIPNIQPNKTYVISIVNNLGIWAEFN